MEIFFDQNFFSKKKSCEIFLLEKFPIFFSKFFSKHVFITLVRGPKTTRKKYLVVFEKFEKSLKKFSRKRGFLILTKFFEKKNIPIFFWEYSKTRAEPSFKSYKKSYEKLSSSFQDMSKKKKVDRPSTHPIPSHPSHPSI